MKVDLKLICNAEDFGAIQEEWIKLLSVTVDEDSILGFNQAFFINNDLVSKYIGQTRADIQRGNIALLVATYKKKIIVCCTLKFSHQQTSHHICDLQKGLIHPDYRRNGLLEKSLAYIASVCIKRNIELITLDVRSNSIGHKIWNKCGFSTYGELEDYSRFNGKSYSGCFMKQSTQSLLEKFHSHLK